MCVWSLSSLVNSIQPSCQPPSVLLLDTTVINVLSSKALLRRIKHQSESQRGQGICTGLTIFDISMVTLCLSVSLVVFLLILNCHLLGNVLVFVVVVNTDLVSYGTLLSVKKEMNCLWRLWVVFTVGSHVVLKSSGFFLLHVLSSPSLIGTAEECLSTRTVCFHHLRHLTSSSWKAAPLRALFSPCEPVT